MNPPESTPLISVIIPTRNGHGTIAHAVKSILEQTYQNTEIIIVSDHLRSIPTDIENADKTEQVLRAGFLSQIDSGRIRIIDGQAKGPGIARNLGVAHAKADFISFLDDDDIWADQHKLALQLGYLKRNPDLYAIGAETTFFIDENGNRLQTISQPTDPAAVYRQMLLRNPLLTSSVLMRKKPFEDFGGFRHMYLAEDYELWLRMGRQTRRDHIYRIGNCPGTSIEYTVRPGSASQKRKYRMAFAVFLLVCDNFFFYPNRFAIVSAKWPAFKRLMGLGK
jgi:glycosyltransferase involved in cell wall biosynthesis